MKNIFRSLIGIILLSCAAAPSAFAVCGNASLTLEAAQDKTQKFIQEMKIAKARGDIETMSKAYASHYSGILQQCTEAEYLKLCGFDCHIQLGEYNLFMANELSYYYTTNQGSMLKPEDMMKTAQNGVDIMEDAKKLLSKQHAGDFRDYVFKGGRYNMILASLYMTVGDIWYQSVSETKLQRLQFLVDKSLGTNTNDDAKASEAELARANYERANWVIQSAGMEIPTDDKQFSELSAESYALRYDIVKRLDSLNKGYIFLNIDPEEFTNIHFDKVKFRLNEIALRIGDAEKNIESLMTNWKQSKLNRDTDQINEEARKKDISIAQSSYRVAQLEGQAEALANEGEGKLLDIKAQQQTYEYEQKKFEYEFGLKMKLQELNDRQKLIEARKEADIVQFELGDQERKLNDLRWLMGWEISLANIQVQLSQFESEIRRYESDKELKKNQIAQIENRKAINELQVKNSVESKIVSQNSKLALETERDSINAQIRKGLEAQICGVQNRMSFIGVAVPEYRGVNACTMGVFTTTASDYQTKMCGADGQGGLRRSLVDLKIKTVADALCLINSENMPAELRNDPIVAANVDACKAKDWGVNNLEYRSQVQFANEIWIKEQALAQAQIDAAEANRVIAASGIATLGAQMVAATATFVTTKAVEKVAEASLAAVVNIPEITVCACAMASGVSTRTPAPKDTLKLTLEAVREGNKTWMQWTDFLAKNLEIARKLTQELKSAQDTLSQGRMAKEVKNFHAMQSIMEILGKQQDIENELQNRILDKATVTLDCEKEGGALEENKKSLQAEFDRLVSEVRALEFKNSNLGLAIDNEVSSQTREDNNASILKLENDNLTLDITAMQGEIKTLDQLIEDTKFRKSLIANLQTNLNKLQVEQDAQSMAIVELTKLKNNKLLALSDKEYEQINLVIEDNKTFTKRMGDFADEAAKLDQLDTGIRQDLVNFKKNISKQVAEERAKIMNTVMLQAQDANGDQKEKLFMATEEQMAAFVKGVPAFIQEKRHLLEEANRLLVLLRNQVNTLVALQGSSPLSLANTEALSYVKNKDDLGRLKDILEDSLWKREQQIVTQTSRILVKSGSGLARSLASEKKASFEISPYARDRMDELGYFSLWNKDFDADSNGLTQNLLLLDVNLLVDIPACPTKQEKRFVISHKGQGLVFKETSDNDPTPVPRLITTQGRSISPTYELSYPGSLIEQTENFWSKNFYLNNFLTNEAPPNFGSAGTLPPFMGLPLIGQYEILLPNPSEGCTYEGASFQLYFTYATKQRSGLFN